MKRFNLKALATALGFLLLFSALYGAAQTTRADAYWLRADGAYRKAFYETSELVESIRVNLSKLLVTGSQSSRRTLTSELALYAEGAQANLAALPANMTFSRGALRFFNQLSDFALTLSGGALTAQDIGTVGTLLDTCETLSVTLLEARERMDAGEDIFEAAGEAVAVDATGAETGTALKYPALLYDGPFSDGRDAGAWSLTGAVYTEEQARQAVVSFLGADRAGDMTLTVESEIPVPCYEFDVQTEDGLLSVAVTRQGGRILYMLCDRAGAKRAFSVAECVDFAARFLSQRGYGEMRVSYWQTEGAMLTVNFAAVQDDVVLYPDLVKVDVSMESGRVVGLEAVNYLKSHKTRALDSPTLTESQAISLIPTGAECTRARLCVIPVDDGEAYCYELSVRARGDNYLIYVDAHTGEERALLKVIDGEDGQLAV